MKKQILTAVLLIVCLLSCENKKNKSENTGAEHNDSEITGIEYIKLKNQLANGWNTWDGADLMTYALLPECISIKLSIKDKNSKKILGRALLTNRKNKNKRDEVIELISHSNDGSYIEYKLSWENMSFNIKYASTQTRDAVMLIEPIDGNTQNGALRIQPDKIWNKRYFNISLEDGIPFIDIPSKKIPVYATKESEFSFSDDETAYIECSLSKTLGISSGKKRSLEEIKSIMDKNRTVHLSKKEHFGEQSETYAALQNTLAWNVIYEPNSQSVMTPVSRIWSVSRGGFVLFCWDTYFASYLHAVDNKELAYANSIEMTNAITESGFIPNIYQANGFKSRDRSQPPVGAITVKEIYRKYREKWFLDETYPKLLTWNRWWAENRDTDGFLCWGSSPYKPIIRYSDSRINSAKGAHFESGLDNSPQYDDVPFDSVTHQMLLADVGLMSLYIMDCEALADIAEVLNKKDNAKELRARGEKYRKNLNKLWDEEDGIYYNMRTDTKEFSKTLATTNFYPLLAKAPTQSQAERMINEHFFNENEFWGDWILPSISRNNPAFKDNHYWRGRVWGPMNILVYLGLRNYNLPRAQKELAIRSNKLLLKEWKENKHVHENYNAVTGEGCDMHSSDPNYHWGALLGLIALIENGYMEAPEKPL